MIEDRAALEAFRCEAGELSRALAGVRGADWARPTRCEPWSVREVLGHIRVLIGWLPQMVEGPAPDRADVSAARYYRPDARFSPQTNAARIQSARDLAADHGDGARLVADFASIWQQAYRQCRDEPVDRVVRTRHGDAMLLSEFLVTRVVELAVHGLDIADALGREPWLTTEAGETALGLVIGPAHREHVRELQWDGPTALRKLTGRAALAEPESSRIERLGAKWITLG